MVDIPTPYFDAKTFKGMVDCLISIAAFFIKLCAAIGCPALIRGTAFFGHIFHVVILPTPKQMLWVYAAWRIAPMQSAIHILTGLSVKHQRYMSGQRHATFHTYIAITML